MARPLRLAYHGAWYHVMNRGLARNPIFLNDEHRATFIDLLFEIHNRYQAEIHAYCLMENHYHIFLRTPLGNISRIMRHLDGVYTQRYNASIKRDGPIFRGRFKAILVEADAYLLRLSRYIHLNPVKAKLVRNAEDYKWSSYYAYINGDEPYWLCTNQTLSYFGENKQREKYKAFTEEGVDKEINDFFVRVRKIPILGTEAFIKTVTEKYLREQHKIRDIPEHKALIRSQICTIRDILKIVANYYSVDEQSLFAATKKNGNRPRAVAIYLSCLFGKHTSFFEIADVFSNITDKGISKSYERFKSRLVSDEKLRMEINELVRRISGFMSIVET